MSASVLRPFHFLADGLVLLHRPSHPCATDCLLEFLECAQTEANWMARLDVRTVPMRAIAHRGDCRLRRTDQLRYLGIRQLRVVLQQIGDCVRLVLPFGDRRITRSAMLDDPWRKRLR